MQPKPSKRPQEEEYTKIIPDLIKLHKYPPNLRHMQEFRKKMTSNRASASMTILDILARVLDSSAIKNEPHEHMPRGWIPVGQEVLRWPLSSRPTRSLSQTYRESCRCKSMKITNGTPINKAATIYWFPLAHKTYITLHKGSIKVPLMYDMSVNHVHEQTYTVKT